MKVRGTTAAIGLLALVAALVLPATGAGAATTYKVSVGKFLKGSPAESMRFLPWSIDVHQGDTLHFNSQSFHTATLLPIGAGIVDWYDANAQIGSSEPYALAQPDTEDKPHTYKFGNLAVFPTSSKCGAPDQPPCSFDGSSVLNSGAPLSGPFDFSVTVDAPVGSSFWVICLVHGPNMRMQVNVVASSDPASDPADLRAANKQAIAQDAATAAALNAKYSTRQTWHVGPGGRRVWDAWAGVDTRHLSLYAMYPHTLRIAKGATVQWHFDSLNFEQHTVSFPSDKAKKIANFTGVACDPDGDSGPLPDGPPDMMSPPFCNDPTQVELHFDPRFVPPQGNGTFKGHDLESSGVRGSEFADANYNLKFGARSSTGFTYICMIHTFMRGRVVVK
jgi:plastocyanin